MRNLLTLGTAALLLATTGCHRKCDDPQPDCAPWPQPQCYAGTFVGDACLDGVLIDVDAATPIGRPTGAYTNVIAAVNFADLGNLNRVGQRVYFTYRNDPSQQAAARVCTANTAPLPVPHLLLSNLSNLGCGYRNNTGSGYGPH